MTRDDVLAEYSDGGWDYPWPEAMADEIVRLRKELEIATSMLRSKSLMINGLQDENDRLRSILSALREPSEAVVEAAGDAFDVIPDFVQRIIRTAVAAAEREVAGEVR